MEFVCADCGHRTPYDVALSDCPHCGGEVLNVRYDYADVAARLPERLPRRGRSLWRYRELLPLRDPSNAVTLGEGGTPLVPAVNLGLMLGCAHLYFKDERQSPTGSFKDRQAAVAVSVMKEAGITEAVVASTGNVAMSYAAYCARAGIRLYAFLTSLVPPEKMREVALHGAQVIKVTGTYDQAKELAKQFAHHKRLHHDRGWRSVASVEGMKTIAFETAEQLALERDLPRSRLDGRPARPSWSGTAVPETSGSSGRPAPMWRAPDWYVQAVSGGLGPIGVMKGYEELAEMGLTDRVPALACIQADGCAPMVHAFRQGHAQAEPVTLPRTRIATLTTGDPGAAYGRIKGLIDRHGGAVESVSDEEAYRALHVMAKMEGLSMEPAAAVAFAGLSKLVRDGRIRPDDVVVINCSGHTFPIANEILGEGWARDLEVPTEQAAAAPQPMPQEGLLAALEQLDERVHSVVIIDDHPDAARLIRRILQARGTYQIAEAHSGREGLELIRSKRPDLVVLDLMMPEMDGFGVLDAMRADEATRDTPVIVATAKELTSDERQRLGGQIESLLRKGSFTDEDLLADIGRVLK